MNSKIKILDCTLRDGGYYNNWNFQTLVINNYLQAVSNSKIDIVEIGFRFIKRNNNFGELAFSEESFLKKINIPKKMKIAVMINGNEFIKNLEKIKKLFVEKRNSKISLVRIAININDYYKIKDIAKLIKSKNYKIAVNLMQSNNIKKNILIKIIKNIKNWKCCDILYFADSFGSMDHVEVKRISLIIKNYWKKDFGFHGHDNRSLALSNTLEAIKNSVTYVDSTILGMGRGAGNLQTEKILIELNTSNKHNGNSKELSICLNDFNFLKSKYGWGSNIFYHSAALNNIHPTYIQTLLSDERYTNKQIFDSIDFLSKKTSVSFDSNIMMNSIYSPQKKKKGEWSALNWLKNKNVLIVGSGPSLINEKNKITNFIKKNNPKVIFLNINKVFNEKIATATIACHEARILGDLNMYKNLKNPLIIPFSNLDKFIKKSLTNNNIYDYSLTLKDDTFQVNSNGCVLKWPLAIAYALAVVTKANAKHIYLAGFDGYKRDDLRSGEMNEIFKFYNKLESRIKLSMITKSIYKI